MIQELNAGEDVVVVNPSGQASNAKDPPESVRFHLDNSRQQYIS